MHNDDIYEIQLIGFIAIISAFACLFSKIKSIKITRTNKSKYARIGSAFGVKDRSYIKDNMFSLSVDRFIDIVAWATVIVSSLFLTWLCIVCIQNGYFLE